MVRAFQSAKGYEQKARVCRAVELPWGRVALPEMVKLLSDADEDLRKVAAEALGKLRPYERDVEFAALIQDPDPGKRIGAARILLDTFNLDALPLIAPCLHDASLEVRKEVVEQVYGLHWEKGFVLGEWAKEFIPLLRDSDERIRTVAATLLGEEGCRAASPELLACLGDPDPWVREVAAKSLGLQGVQEAAPRLEALLDDPEDRVRRAAAEALGKLGTPRAIPRLLRSMSGSEKDTEVRAAAIVALGALKARDAMGEGRKLLRGPEPTLARAAARLLLDLGDRDSATALADLVRKQDWSTLEFVGSNFPIKGWPELDSALMALLKDGDAEIRNKVLQILWGTRLEQSDADTVRCLSDPDPRVRDHAMWRVENFRIREATPELRKLLQHPHLETRQRAMDTLVALIGKRAGPDLVPLLEDPSPRVRESALYALDKLDRPEDLPGMIRLFEDPDPSVRETA
ncbi:MAG TPA: HEAT repeat domain-containing protein, partial [Planctomycetota bacterium]|nr:HEAT repeat domain-containing protein [Planctomycetota bacterium]